MIAEFTVAGLVAMSVYIHHVKNNDLIIKIYLLFCWGANAVLQLWDLQLWDLQFTSLWLCISLHHFHPGLEEIEIMGLVVLYIGTENYFIVVVPITSTLVLKELRFYSEVKELCLI